MSTDETVSTLARAARGGVVTEAQARRDILTHVYASGIIEDSIRLWVMRHHVPAYLDEEVRAYVRAFFTDHVLTVGSPKVDLDRLAEGASVSGMVRRMVNAPTSHLMPTALRRARTRWGCDRVYRGHHPTGAVNDRGEPETLFDTLSTSGQEDLDRPHVERVRAAHEDELDHALPGTGHLVQARAVRSLYELPEPDRPLGALRRAALRLVLDSSPECALEAARAMLMTYGTEHAGDCHALAGVFAGYSDEDLRAMICSPMPAHVTRAVAAEALEDLPYVSVGRQRRIVELARRRLGQDAPAVVGAYIAHEHAHHRQRPPRPTCPDDGYRALLETAGEAAEVRAWLTGLWRSTHDQ